MGDYTEFLRIQSQHAENKRRKKNKEHKKQNKRRKRAIQNEYTLAPLEAAGLYTPMSKHLPGRHDQSSHGNRIGAHWGASHTGSSNITAAAARAMGRDGFTFEDTVFGEAGDSRRTRLAARSALRGVRDSRGGEALYSGHKVASGTKPHGVGEEIEIPMMATSGDRDTASQYSSVKEGQERDSVLYVFEEGTKFKGYQKNENYDRDDEDWNYKWDEALVSGRFEVVAVDQEEDSFFHYGNQEQTSYNRTVYTLRQTAVFDPDKNEWVSVVGKRWHFDPRQPRDRRGRWSDTGLGMDAPNARRLHRDDVSPFPAGQTSPRRATGARAATPAKKATAKKIAAKKTTPAPAKKVAAKKVAAKKATPAKKTAAAPVVRSGDPYDHTTGSVVSRSSIPRINRGGTHIMQGTDGRPMVANPYGDPGEAYYQRNVGPNRITDERLRQIFEDPSKMTQQERRMIASAGGAKSLDGTSTITVDTSRGPRDLDRYQVIGQLRSKIAPGSGDRSAQREGLSEERREKMAAKRRESGKPSAAEFGKMQKQITDDWSTDGGKTVKCVFCNKAMSPRGMSIETPKPKQLGGNYRDRGGRWPAHNSCNTKAGQAAQADPIAYQEEMMKKFERLPHDVKIRLPHVYAYFPKQLGKYPGTAAERKKYMATGPKS